MREEDDDEEKEEEAGRARTCETPKTCFSQGERDVLDSSSDLRQKQTRRRGEEEQEDKEAAHLLLHLAKASETLAR